MTKTRIRLLVFLGSILASTCPSVFRADAKPSARVIAGHRVLRIYDLGMIGLRDPNVNVIFEGREGRVWAGTNTGLIQYDERDGSWLALKENRGTSPDRVTMIGESSDQKLWFGRVSSLLRPDSGLRWFDGNRAVKTDKNNQPQPSEHWDSSEPIRGMFQGRDSRLWFVVEDGLLFFDGKIMSSPISLSQATGERGPILVNAGYQDSRGYIWLARSSRGLIRLDEMNGEWKMYDPMRTAFTALHDGLDVFREINASNIKAIYEDAERRLWFAAANGVVYLHRPEQDSWQSFNLLDHLPTIVGQPAGLSNLRVSAIYADSAERIFFGTDKGLLVFFERENRWEQFTSRNSALPSDRINTIIQDRMKRIWIGTKGVLLLE